MNNMINVFSSAILKIIEDPLFNMALILLMSLIVIYITRVEEKSKKGYRFLILIDIGLLVILFVCNGILKTIIGL